MLMLAGLVPSGQASARPAHSFSVDLVRRTGDAAAAAPAGRLYVAAEKVRLDTPELADGYFISDSEKPAAFFVRPSARVYMDARQSSRLIQLFVPIDPTDPCRQWQTMARLAGEPDRGAWQCAEIGNETIGGRELVVYRARVGNVEQFTGWIDPQLTFPVQIKLQEGVTFAAEAVHEQVLASEAFEIPAGFRKFDPQALLERVKQSDVWVDGH
jgi:hypothetical protein